MYLMKVDPRALKDNPDNSRQSKSTPQADALLLATIKAVGVIQPPVVFPERDGGNGLVIEAGHRRRRQAVAAGLEEIDVLVVEAANDNGAMRSMVKNIAREPLNPVDQWRGIERLVALDWTEEAIAVALTLPVRQIRKLRLLANVLPAMLDHIAKGDMPSEQQLRTIAAAALDEQKEVWKAHKPKKGETAAWWSVANALSKKRMYAKDASFGDDLREAYGIEWVEDLFARPSEIRRLTSEPIKAFPLSVVLKACPTISDYGPGGAIGNWRDLMSAAVVVRSVLGVSPSAYQEACEAMGAGECGGSGCLHLGTYEFHQLRRRLPKGFNAAQ